MPKAPSRNSGVSLRFSLGTKTLVHKEHQGFLPTAIRIVPEVPGSTSTGLPSDFSCGGEMLEERLRLSATAALTGCGSSSSGSDWRTASGCSESTDTCMPVITLTGTAKSTCLPYTLTAAKPPGGFTLFHPAPCKALSIALRRSMDSSSWKTEEKVYSVPLNTCSVVISPGIFTSDRGDLSRFNSAVASAARFRASARCDSASVACLFADAMSFSKESASCLALVARAKALDADALALSESASALPDDCSAAPDCARAIAELPMAAFAFSLASPAFWSSDPISALESVLALTRHKSSSANANMSRSVDSFARRSLLSLIPPVTQFVKSAMYSPAQATATSAQEMYSPYSHIDNAFEIDVTACAVKIIFVHARRPRSIPPDRGLPMFCGEVHKSGGGGAR
jgi:hypothetical protein